MGLKSKEMILRQKAGFEMELRDRMAYLSGKGITSPKLDRDTLVKKLKAQIKAMNKRLRAITEGEKRAEDIAKIKAERAAALKEEKEGGKAKSKKAAEEGAGKKAKGEKKAAPPKAAEGGKNKKKPEASETAPAKTE